jgi:hypothetical protein
MQIKRQLAADSTALEDPIDALVEVSTEMLEENLGPARSTGHQVLPAPREAEMNADTDQSPSPERVARMSDTELEQRPISPKAQKQNPKDQTAGRRQ